MKINEEHINLIKQTKSIEELESKAKENGYNLNQETLKTLFDTYCVKNLDLPDEEIDSVTGGCGDDEPRVYYNIRCSKCGHVLAGVGDFDKEWANKNLADYNKFGCNECHSTNSFEIVYSYDCMNWYLYTE